MTCFWNAIINRLDKEDYKLLELKPIKRNIRDIKQFIHQLKLISDNVNFNILWQKKDLNDQEKKEMKDFIKIKD